MGVKRRLAARGDPIHHSLKILNSVYQPFVYFVANKKIDLGFLVDDWSILPSLHTRGGHTKNAREGESVKDLIRTIYGSFHVEDGTVHVGLVKSGATAKVVFDFNTNKDLDGLDEAVEELSFSKSAQSNIGNL